MRQPTRMPRAASSPTRRAATRRAPARLTRRVDTSRIDRTVMPRPSLDAVDGDGNGRRAATAGTRASGSQRSSSGEPADSGATSARATGPTSGRRRRSIVAVSRCSPSWRLDDGDPQPVGLVADLDLVTGVHADERRYVERLVHRCHEPTAPLRSSCAPRSATSGYRWRSPWVLWTSITTATSWPAASSAQVEARRVEDVAQHAQVGDQRHAQSAGSRPVAAQDGVDLISRRQVRRRRRQVVVIAERDDVHAGCGRPAGAARSTVSSSARSSAK